MNSDDEYKQNTVQKEAYSPPATDSNVADYAYDQIEEKRLIRKVDWRLLPILGALYSIALIDRTNVSSDLPLLLTSRGNWLTSDRFPMHGLLEWERTSTYRSEIDIPSSWFFSSLPTSCSNCLLTSFFAKLEAPTGWHLLRCHGVLS